MFPRTRRVGERVRTWWCAEREWTHQSSGIEEGRCLEEGDQQVDRAENVEGAHRERPAR